MINFLENILIAATIVSSIYVFPVELKVLCYDLNETPNSTMYLLERSKRTLTCKFLTYILHVINM